VGTVLTLHGLRRALTEAAANLEQASAQLATATRECALPPARLRRLNALIEDGKDNCRDALAMVLAPVAPTEPSQLPAEARMEQSIADQIDAAELRLEESARAKRERVVSTPDGSFKLHFGSAPTPHDGTCSACGAPVGLGFEGEPMPAGTCLARRWHGVLLPACARHADPGLVLGPESRTGS
jgi:hypothetical protein